MKQEDRNSKKEEKPKVNSQKGQGARMIRYQNLKSPSQEEPKTKYSSSERRSLQNIILTGVIQETDKGIHQIHDFYFPLAEQLQEKQIPMFS